MPQCAQLGDMEGQFHVPSCSTADNPATGTFVKDTLDHHAGSAEMTVWHAQSLQPVSMHKSGSLFLFCHR